MFDVKYDVSGVIEPAELTEFYGRMRHEISASPEQVHRMVNNSDVFVSARIDGKLIGMARGICDGLRGYLTECKLDPVYQGPAAVTKMDGRIEHDSYGIAAEMARRVIDSLRQEKVTRIDVLAWGTEVDFLEELGFKRSGGLVALTMRADSRSGAGQVAGAVTA